MIASLKEQTCLFNFFPLQNGVTPLMVACLSGDICCQAALILITHDARVNGLPNVGTYPVKICPISSDQLINIEPYIFVQIDDKPLICASAGGNIKLVKHLLTYAADINQKHGVRSSTFMPNVVVAYDACPTHRSCQAVSPMAWERGYL